MGSTCSIQTTYGVGLVNIFVKGTAWVAEPLAPGGRGLKMCRMFTHVINCTVCYSISSSSMEINVPLGTNCLTRSWVLWCSAQPSKTVYSQLPMIKVQSTLVDRLKKKQILRQRWRSECFWLYTSKKNQFNFVWPNYISSQTFISTELSSLLRF